MGEEFEFPLDSCPTAHLLAEMEHLKGAAARFLVVVDDA